MIKADNTVKFCYIACPPRQPCTCRNMKYPKVPNEVYDNKDKLLDDKFGGTE